MGDVPVQFAGLTPAIIIIIGVLRHAEILTDRYTPLVAVAIGVAVAIVLIVTGALAWLPALVGGVAAGGAAVGLHQVPKQIQKG